MSEQRDIQSKKKKTGCLWVGILFVLIVIGSTALLFNFFAVPEIKYQRALRLAADHQYVAAIGEFEALGDYKDAAAQLIPLYAKVNGYASVGFSVYFGFYEQDNDTTNGKEKIEWKVIAQEKDKVLLLSEKNLDCIPYNLIDEIVTWESCSLRSWLNTEFFNTAFTVDEQDAILTSEIITNDNSMYKTKGGDAVRDKLFLLSIEEANRYFDSDAARITKNTSYAVEKNAFNSTDGEGWWWLRSPGLSGNIASTINYSGAVDEYGNFVFSLGGCIRPAFWINQGDLVP